MRFEDLNWMDVEKYLENDDRLILVVGAAEQHGYLSLLTDVKIPLALADAASKETGVLIAPPVNFGVSPYFVSYPGTISLRIATLLALMNDIFSSVYQQGFRRILVLNGHGGNAPIETQFFELADQFPEIKLSWYAWWQSPAVKVIAEKHDLQPEHANWLEAFSFTQITDLPDNEKPFPDPPAIKRPEIIRNVYGDGSFGGKYVVDAAIMDEIFQACLKDILELLEFKE